MHHKGGVSKAVKFSLAGNTEATAAAVEKERQVFSSKPVHRRDISSANTLSLGSCEYSPSVWSHFPRLCMRREFLAN